MIETKEIIIKLKEAKREKNLSLNAIVEMVEANGQFVSKSSVQRVFADGSEDSSFRYDDTIRPLVKALLDVDTIEETDDEDTKVIKSLLKLKIQRIQELEKQIDDLRLLLSEEKVKSHEKIEKERTQYERHIKLLDEQISIKDKRMEEMKARFDKKDEHYTELVNRLLDCHCCGKGDKA